MSRSKPTTGDGKTPAQGDQDASYEEVWRLISSASRTLVLTHANPDADAVASVLAVADALAARGQQVTPSTGDGTLPSALEFLPGSERIVDPRGLLISDYDVLVMLDCAEAHRVGGLYHVHREWFDGRIPVVNVDHHVTNPHFGAASIVDASAAATCEILACLFLELDLPMHPDVATCLLAGIHGDTLGLRTPSTTSRTLRVVAELLDRGADQVKVIDHLFRIKPFTTVKLWGLALSRAQMIGDLVWTEVTPEMLEASGAVPAEGEGIVNFVTGTAGARAGALFYKQPDGWRVSLRSIGEDVDVSALARLYGGGGHARAAGCTLRPGEDARQAFLQDISERITLMERSHFS